MYLKGGNYQTIIENQVEKYVISLSSSFETIPLDVKGNNTLSFRIYSYDADGSGTIILQYSINGVEWETVTDSSSNNMSWVIDGTDIDGSDIQLPANGYYRLKYTFGTNTAGTMIIEAER